MTFLQLLTTEVDCMATSFRLSTIHSSVDSNI